MNLDRNVVMEGVKLIIVNYSIVKPDQEITDFIDQLTGFMRLEGVNNKTFNYMIYQYIKNVKNSDYNKLPAIADLLSFLNQNCNIEDIARKQLHVLKNAELCHDKIIFDDLVTNYVVKNDFNGLKKIDFDNEYFDNKFIKSYISAYKNGLYEDEYLEYYAKIDNLEDVKLGLPAKFFKSDKVLVIGDKSKVKYKYIIEQPYKIKQIKKHISLNNMSELKAVKNG